MLVNNPNKTLYYRLSPDLIDQSKHACTVLCVIEFNLEIWDENGAPLWYLIKDVDSITQNVLEQIKLGNDDYWLMSNKDNLKLGILLC